MTDKMTREQVEEAVSIARAKGQRPYFRGADLSGLYLSHMDLHDVNFRCADLRGTKLRSADLADSNLTGAKMSLADLSDADLRRATFNYADLYRTCLFRADLREADFIGANLFRADLYRADMRSADLHGANLRDADLSYTVLTGANFVGLVLDGLPSGRLVFIPTPEGWQLNIGCWDGTTAELREMIAKDEDWPGAEGEEITERRPMLEAAADMCDSYAAANPHAVADMKSAAERWKENR